MGYLKLWDVGRTKTFKTGCLEVGTDKMMSA